MQDTKVNLKKKFNDQGQRTRGLLSGDQWYCQQAFRSVRDELWAARLRQKGQHRGLLMELVSIMGHKYSCAWLPCDASLAACTWITMKACTCLPPRFCSLTCTPD